MEKSIEIIKTSTGQKIKVKVTRELFNSIGQVEINPIGAHFLIELDGVRGELNNSDFVEKTLQEAALAANAQIIFSKFHAFEPQGITGCVGVEESHLTAHTWPEFIFAALDVFLCNSEDRGKKIEPEKAFRVMLERFMPSSARILQVHRGPIKKPSVNPDPPRKFYEGSEF